MIWVFFTVVAIGLVGVVAALVTSRISYDPMAPAVSSTPDVGLPPERIHGIDVEGVRFDTALRGYRMDQVDEVLVRLQQRLEEQDTELTAWRRGGASEGGSGGVHPEPDQQRQP